VFDRSGVEFLLYHLKYSQNRLPAPRNFKVKIKNREVKMSENGNQKNGFVALSRFVIKNDMQAEVRAAFHNRPHLVDEAPGFLRMEVLSPQENSGEIWLMTFWSDEESFRTWHHSHLYRESHKGIPRGLKLVPKSVELRFFEHICS
jgi:heme-degrading monooxygenase HmoA